MNEHRRAPQGMTHSLYSPLPFPPRRSHSRPPRVFIRASSGCVVYARGALAASARARQPEGFARHLPGSLNLADDRVESSPLDRVSCTRRSRDGIGAFQIRRDFVTRFTKGDGRGERRGDGRSKGRGANELSLSFSCCSPSRTCADISLRRDPPRSSAGCCVRARPPRRATFDSTSLVDRLPSPPLSYVDECWINRPIRLRPLLSGRDSSARFTRVLSLGGETRSLSLPSSLPVARLNPRSRKAQHRRCSSEIFGAGKRKGIQRRRCRQISRDCVRSNSLSHHE